MSLSSVYEDDFMSVLKSIPEFEKMFGKSYFITGASGLIGSALVDFFSVLNNKCHADIRMLLGSRNKKTLERRFGDLLNMDGIDTVDMDPMSPILTDKKPDYIIHAASPANPTWYAEKPVETMQSVFWGLNNVLEFARNKKVHRTLFISSSEVYGQKASDTPYNNNEYGFLDILNPRACYPSAKRAGETLCASYYQEYLVDSVIARPGHVYGPYVTDSDSRASSAFVREVVAGNDIVMKTAGLQKRSYCYICDCVSALMTVLLHGRSLAGYNISNPDSVCTIRDMAECIAHYGDKKVNYTKATELEKRGYNLMENSSLNSDDLQELGWRGMFDLNTGVCHTIQILSNND